MILEIIMIILWGFVGVVLLKLVFVFKEIKTTFKCIKLLNNELSFIK